MKPDDADRVRADWYVRLKVPEFALDPLCRHTRQQPPPCLVLIRARKLHDQSYNPSYTLLRNWKEYSHLA